jgi:hypothetical protein
LLNNCGKIFKKKNHRQKKVGAMPLGVYVNPVKNLTVNSLL